MADKILLIGIDGGTWRILGPLVEGGRMPTLARWIKQGQSGNLTSSIPPVTPVAWSSFQTGCRPGKHGVFGFVNLDRNDKSIHFSNSRSIRVKTLWEWLSAAGKYVSVINVPMTYPPRAVKGIMVSGLLTPSLHSQFTFPQEFGTELLRAIPDYAVLNERSSPILRAQAGGEAFVRAMIDMVKMRTRAAVFVMKDYPWDVFMVHFQANDMIQHPLWYALDGTHPKFDDQAHERVVPFYEALDESLSKIDEVVPDGSPRIVISDHGFQTLRKTVQITDWLVKNGFLAVRQPKGFAMVVQKAVDLAKRIDRYRFRDRFLRPVTRENLYNRLQQSRVYDWERSRVFGLAEHSYGVFHVFEEGAAKKATIEEISVALKELADPDTGQPIVAEVLKGEDLYGNSIAARPDLVAVPAPGYCFHRGESKEMLSEPMIGEDYQIGIHEPAGVYVAVGPGFEPGSRRDADIIDIAPTVLALLGLPIPDTMDGRSLVDSSAGRLHAGVEIIQASEHGDDVYSDEERAAIQKRLADLGYL